MSLRKVGQASLIIALGTASVNLLQLLKLIIVGAWFGASVGRLDQYSVTINLLAAVQGVLLGALQVAFIPVYVGYRARGEHQRAERAMQTVATACLVFVALLAIVLAGAASPLLRIAAVGFDADAHSLNVSLFRLGLIYMCLNVLCDMLTTFYNANKSYAVPALAPAVSMAVSIAYLLVFRNQGVHALLYGLIWGNVAQIAILLRRAPRSAGFRLSFARRDLLHADARPVYRMMIPMAASLGLSHLNILIDQGVASTLGTGAVSVLYYATRLHDVLVKLFICSVAAALLPYLSQYVAERRLPEMRNVIAVSIRAALLILIPGAVFVFFLGGPLIAAVLQRQAFTAADAVLVGNVWAAYSIGLFFIATVFFQQRCFMANRDMLPLWIAPAFGLPLNLILDIWFARLWGVPGIALGTTSVYFLYMLLYGVWLTQWFRRDGIPTPRISPAWKPLAAVLILALACWLMSTIAHKQLAGPLLAGPASLATRTSNVAIIICIVGSCCGIYIGTLKVLHIVEIGAIVGFLRKEQNRQDS
jgi:putative peptidoglycan lipid II flippase